MKDNRSFPPASDQLRPLRDKMLRDTERYLGDRLPGHDVSWPATSPHAGSDSARGNGQARVRRPNETMRVRTLPGQVCAIEVAGNANGHFDTKRARELIDVMFAVAEANRRESVIVDMAKLHSITAQFLNVLCAFVQRMRSQRRHVVLCGVNSPCATLLRIAELSLPCFATQNDARCVLELIANNSAQ